MPRVGAVRITSQTHAGRDKEESNELPYSGAY